MKMLTLLPTIEKKKKEPANHCLKCPAQCCQHISFQFDTPRKLEDFEKIRWYVSHKNIFVYVTKHEWYLNVVHQCSHLLPDNMCSAYEIRPQICRDYDNQDCVYHGEGEDEELKFEKPKDVDKYLKKRWPGCQPKKIYSKIKKKKRKSEWLQDIIIKIDTPTSKVDFDTIRWYVSHRDIYSFKDKRSWYIGILAEKDQRYTHEMDRSFTIPEDAPHLFMQIDEVDRYMDERWKTWNNKEPAK